MKSTEVYKEINKIIYPTLKSNGFKKVTSGMLGFYKLLKEYHLVIWFQCSQDGFDIYAGSKFIIEIQISKSNDIGAASIFSRRIPYFLTEKEFNIIVKIENEIKDKLQKTSKNHYIFSLAENIQNWYTNKFKKVNKSYNNSSDIWFIYFDQADIEKWVKIVEPMIIRIIYDFEKTDY